LIGADAEPGPIRFGVLYGGGRLENWQLRCLTQLAAVPNAQALLSIAPERSRIPLPGDCADLPNIPLNASAQLKSYALDFILSFEPGTLPAEVLELARHGVWRYHFGDWTTYRDSAGFWEVYEQCAVSSALLVRVQADPDAVVVMREGHLRTLQLSASRNAQQLQERFTHWPAELCRELTHGRFQPARGAALLRTTATARGTPTAAQRALLAMRVAVGIAATAWRSFFRHDQWNIGIVDAPIEKFLEMSVPQPVTWLPATPTAEYRADPFGTWIEGRLTILCEYYSYRDDRGYIVAIDAGSGEAGAQFDARGVRVQIGPETPVHLSYPYLFETDGRLCCAPESSAAQEIAVYDIEHFPDRWTRTDTLIAGRGIVDATVFQHGDLWWMAASELAAKGANSELHLWFAERLGGPWQPHPGNPVKIDVRSARPAGTPFWVAGVMYRPAQDCSSTYGARVTINRVLTLTPFEFREEEAATVNPDLAGKYPKGLHTVSACGNKTLIDGKRSVFAFDEFLRVLRQRLP
jgi:hypothetical protein